MMIILLPLLTSLQQVINYKIIGGTEPALAFFTISIGSLLLYLLYLSFFFTEELRSNLQRAAAGTIGINNLLVIFLGQILSPYFYFLGAATTPLYLQSATYLLYPLLVTMSGRFVVARRQIAVISAISALIILAQVPNLLGSLENVNPMSLTYLLLSVACLISHKLLHRRQVESHASLSPSEFTFFGLVFSAVFSLIWISVELQFEDLVAASSFFDLDSPLGLLKGLALGVCFTVFIWSHYLRNKIVGDRKYLDYLVLLLLTPVFSEIINNSLTAIFNTGTISLGIYSGFSIAGIVTLVAFNRGPALIGFFAVFYALPFPYYRNIVDARAGMNGVHKMTLLPANITSKKSLIELNGRTYFINQTDGAPSSPQPTIVNSTLELAIPERSETTSYYIQSILEQPGVMSAISIRDGRRYVIKELDSGDLNRYRELRRLDFHALDLTPFELAFDPRKDPQSGRPYIVMPFVYGQTFDRYFYQDLEHSWRFIDEKELIAKVAEVIELNLALIKSGWINRDSHQMNLMVTPEGIKVLDYDFVFPVSSTESKTIDSFGFDTPLHDYYALFFDRRKYWANSQEKFRFVKHERLEVKNHSDAINANLALMKTLIYDRSYYFRAGCAAELDHERAFNVLLQDVRHLTEPASIQNRIAKGREGISLDRAIEMRSLPCVRRQMFFDRYGKPSFVIHSLPTSLYPTNVLEPLKGFSLDDLDSEVNRSIARTMMVLTSDEFILLESGKSRAQGGVSDPRPGAIRRRRDQAAIQHALSRLLDRPVQVVASNVRPLTTHEK